MNRKPEDLLRTVFQELERTAPPPPVEDLRRRLAASGAAAEPRPWWREIWDALVGHPPYQVATAAGQSAVGQSELGFITAGVQHQKTVISVAVTQKPVIAKDGSLVLAVRLEQGFDKGEPVELTLLSHPDPDVVGAPVQVTAGEETLLRFELSDHLRDAWRDIDARDWESLPLRLALRGGGPRQG